MTPETAIDKITQEMIDLHYILPFQELNIRRYLEMSGGVYFNEGLRNHVTSRKAIVQYDKNGKHIKDFESAAQAERMTGIDRNNINRCCNKKGLKSAGGFIWKFNNLH